MFSDYHVHSSFSFDSDESPENVIKQALQLNMKQICFTDHQDYLWPVKGETSFLDFDKYFKTLSELHDKYKHGIEILIGIEIGFTKENASLNQELVKRYPFDFVIGSCHVVDNMDPYYKEFWQGRDDREAFELYFNTLLTGLKTFNSFDTLGHLDYIVRYSPNKDANYSPLDYQDIIDEILKLIIDKNIKLEINTANLSKGFTYPNPHTDIIKRYKELGGNYVTLGSDAHKAEHIGYGFDVAKEIIENYSLNIFTK